MLSKNPSASAAEGPDEVPLACMPIEAEDETMTAEELVELVPLTTPMLRVSTSTTTPETPSCASSPGWRTARKLNETNSSKESASKRRRPPTRPRMKTATAASRRDYRLYPITGGSPLVVSIYRKRNIFLGQHGRVVTVLARPSKISLTRSQVVSTIVIATRLLNLPFRYFDLPAELQLMVLNELFPTARGGTLKYITTRSGRSALTIGGDPSPVIAYRALLRISKKFKRADVKPRF
ncbi:uncharacterized protein BDZ99DRAFT_514097 [Mytilinidion resinicola]|uniref:Uncharacterized protein n=1 Tax=Mytilinidion resinicola TaxID=574789 RepID=A0A6A6ZAL5_9PEZI|nr:uncharacterized protein BDZ99DRAFT_514097 [Mytilinidion resinicola]KAF2817878.1 hypothetical protein BDZ99DRAFT_514097 [Mytilinidion resinicola]